MLSPVPVKVPVLMLVLGPKAMMRMEVLFTSARKPLLLFPLPSVKIPMFAPEEMSLILRTMVSVQFVVVAPVTFDDCHSAVDDPFEAPDVYW